MKTNIIIQTKQKNMPQQSVKIQLVLLILFDWFKIINTTSFSSIPTLEKEEQVKEIKQRKPQNGDLPSGVRARVQEPKRVHSKMDEKAKTNMPI